MALSEVKHPIGLMRVHPARAELEFVKQREQILEDELVTKDVEIASLKEELKEARLGTL